MSANPRRANWKARERVVAIVRERAANGEPCGICGKPIDVDAPQWYVDPRDGKRKRAPWSLECDEIVPLARGGSPIDEANCQPAHRACNLRKGARMRRTVVEVDGSGSATWL